ncbi:hypothetical protein [Pacificibacter maritimus]|nr:hypothetical protein [Pacificibacter maritimus]
MTAGRVDHGNDPILSRMNHLPDAAKIQLNALWDGVSVPQFQTED